MNKTIKDVNEDARPLCWNIAAWSRWGHTKDQKPPPIKLISLGDKTNFPSSSSSLLLLPGEVRNKIFENCYLNATFCPRCLENHKLTASISHNMQILGLGPFPLLFTNKQIHNELLSLIYSHLKPLYINGYFIQTPESSPSNPQLSSSRPIWPSHVHVQRFAKKAEVIMRYEKPRSSTSGSWCYCCRRLIFDCYKGGIAFNMNRQVLKELAKYLRTFTSLAELEIIIEVCRPPYPYASPLPKINGLEQLLGLYSLCGERTTVRFEMKNKKYELGLPRDTVEPKDVVVRWMRAWKRCLVGNGLVGGRFVDAVEEVEEVKEDFVQGGRKEWGVRTSVGACYALALKN